MSGSKFDEFIAECIRKGFIGYAAEVAPPDDRPWYRRMWSKIKTRAWNFRVKWPYRIHRAWLALRGESEE